MINTKTKRYITMHCGCRHDSGSQHKRWTHRCDEAKRLWAQFMATSSNADRQKYDKHYDMRLFTFKDRTGKKYFQLIAANFQIAVQRIEKDTGLSFDRKEFQWHHDCPIPIDMVVVVRDELSGQK